MKTQKNILIAFILNLLFSVFELLGGIWIGSISIISDALHDFGDAVSIGIAAFLEKKSKQQPDMSHTYGYIRYSVLGSAMTTLILLIGSFTVICHSIERIFHPNEIQYNGMIIFACVGVVVNLIAAFVTRQGESLNQKAVNLHMMEDVLGWIVVLVGGIVMRFTDLPIIDPLLSIGVSVFILIHALKQLKEVLNLFLKKTPEGICVSEIRKEILQTEGVTDVHHIHIWSIDGLKHCATMHIRATGDSKQIKHQVRHILAEHNIVHSVLELETEDETCTCPQCGIHQQIDPPCHGHHHHH